jgi:hypothetical protein
MEDFKMAGLHQATRKPPCRFLYIDDTFVIKLHGPKMFRDFTDHQNIQFTMETERERACYLHHAGFMLGLFFDPEGGGDMLL